MRTGRPDPGAARLTTAFAAGLLLILAAVPALAQERTPEQRRTLEALAGVLGEAHALRQACAPDDQMWRSRMQRLLEVEAPDAAFAAALAARFNGGFDLRRREFAKCDPRASRVEAEVAARGRTLADALAREP